MPIRGHTPRILGTVLIVVGSVLLAAGILSAIIGLVWAKDASSNNQRPPSDLGEVLQGLILGGVTGAGIGLAVLVVGLVLRGVGKALHERAARLDAIPDAGLGQQTA